MYTEIRTAIEVTSAIICFILLRFMIKPYENTGESRYLGLPLGFGFLGATHVVSAVTFYAIDVVNINIYYVQLIARTFAFTFIAITYYFSKKPNSNSQSIWKITLTLLIVLLTISILLVSIPNFTIDSYIITRYYFRVINIIIILYICIHTFRTHIRNPDPATIWIPLGYVILLVSQYTLLLFQLDMSWVVLFAALILRMLFLFAFLVVTLRVFYRGEKG